MRGAELRGVKEEDGLAGRIVQFAPRHSFLLFVMRSQSKELCAPGARCVHHWRAEKSRDAGCNAIKRRGFENLWLAPGTARQNPGVAGGHNLRRNPLEERFQESLQLFKRIIGHQTWDGSRTGRWSRHCKLSSGRSRSRRLQQRRPDRAPQGGYDGSQRCLVSLRSYQLGGRCLPRGKIQPMLFPKQLAWRNVPRIFSQQDGAKKTALDYARGVVKAGGPVEPVLLLEQFMTAARPGWRLGDMALIPALGPGELQKYLEAPEWMQEAHRQSSSIVPMSPIEFARFRQAHEPLDEPKETQLNADKVVKKKRSKPKDRRPAREKWKKYKEKRKQMRVADPS